MNINDLKNMKRQPALTAGTHEVTFTRINFGTDEFGEVTHFYVNTKEFRPFRLPLSDDMTFQLDYLLEQLGIDAYDPDIINSKTGKKIKVTGTVNDKYVNANLNANAQPAVELA